MGDRTSISWTDSTWNPVSGCSHVSPGCEHCYAEKLSHRFRWTSQPWAAQHAKENVRLHEDRLEQPGRWMRPRRVFVCSMGDLFHERVADEFIDRVWAVMRRAGWHTFQILTKRADRLKGYLEHAEWRIHKLAPPAPPRHWYYASDWRWPLPNVWVGVSVEDQRRAEERIPLLLQVPAAVRFVSCEPLLGPLDLTNIDGLNAFTGEWTHYDENGELCTHDEGPGLSWVIVGGESGGPPERRLVELCAKCHAYPAYRDNCQTCAFTGWTPKPEALSWVRSLRDQCLVAGVPIWWKQFGPRPGLGREIDGVRYEQFPEVRA